MATRWLVGVFGVVLAVGCGDDGDGGGDEATGSSQGVTDDGANANDDGEDSADESGAEDPGCIPGVADCVCLNDGCAGMLECVDNVCVAGPTFDVDEQFEVIAGLRLPIDLDGVRAEEFSMRQVSGPEVVIDDSNPLRVLVDVPPDAPVKETIVLRVDGTLNTVESFAEITVTILEPVFEDFLPKITDPEQLGTTEGLEMGQGGMWVGSFEGFVSRFNPDGTFSQRIDVAGTPVGINLGRLPQGEDELIDVLYIANQGNSAVEALTVMGGTISTVTNAITAGGGLGEVNYVLPDGDGTVYFTNRTGGQVFRYEPQTGTTTVLVTADDLATNPNALSFGPENGVLYVGAVDTVWRVGLTDKGTAGEISQYLNVPGGGEVDGIAFDEGGTMYAGFPNSSSLHLARYEGSRATETVRSFSSVGEGISGFVNVQFGGDGFDRRSVYWTNLDGGTVGRLYVGVVDL